MKKEAIYSSRIIKPGYYIKAMCKDNNRHILNMCKSKAVEISKDSYNIPTLLSEKREHNDKHGKVNVYDAVFNDSVLEKEDIKGDLLKLACSCISELFKVELMPSS